MTHIGLSGLSEPEVAALIGILGGHGDPAPVRAETGGNPLLVQEAATGGRTGSLGSLVCDRYARLHHSDLAVLDLAAVVGHEFDADLLAAAALRPVPAVIDALEHAEVAGLIVRKPGRPDRFSFVHSLFRDIRYDRIPEHRRMHLHRRVAGALEGLDGERSGPDLARHVATGAHLGDPTYSTSTSATGRLVDRVRRSLRESGDRAMALNDLTAARRSYQEALDLWPRGDPERPSLLLDLGRTLLTLESDGADVLGEARDGLLALGDDERAAEAEMMLGELDWISSRWDDAETHFQRAATLVADHAASRATARVIGGLARFRMIGGANRQARRDATLALEMARALELRVLEANVLNTLGPARVNDGDLGGIDDLKAGIELAEALGSPEASAATRTFPTSTRCLVTRGAAASGAAEPASQPSASATPRGCAGPEPTTSRTASSSATGTRRWTVRRRSSRPPKPRRTIS